MFYTLTLNPCFDRTVRLSEPLLPGALHRLAEAATVTPGGKGVGVSRALTALGAENVALVAVGGERGDAYLEALRTEGITAEAIPGTGVRENLSILGADGRQTEVNEPGFPAPDAERAAADYLRAHLSRGDVVILSGSLPAGCDADTYARLVEVVHGCEANAVVDTSGDALAAALEAGADLLKPNAEEFAALCRAKLPGAILPGPVKKDVFPEDADKGASPDDAVKDASTDDADKENGSTDDADKDASPDGVLQTGASPEDAARRALALSDAAEEFVGCWGGSLLVTDGAFGAVYADSDAVVYSPAEAVDHPKALKGAGDTYLAAFLWATFCLRLPVIEAMRAATSAAAALVACGTLPAKDALLSLYEREKTENEIQQRFIE